MTSLAVSVGDGVAEVGGKVHDELSVDNKVVIGFSQVTREHFWDCQRAVSTDEDQSYTPSSFSPRVLRTLVNSSRRKS